MACDTPMVNPELVKKTKESMISEREIYEISDFFKIFGDSTRLQILWSLDNNPMTVGDICNVLSISKSACSHQLNILKANKLVKYLRSGKNVIYTLDDEHVSIIIETARQHLKEQ